MLESGRLYGKARAYASCCHQVERTAGRGMNRPMPSRGRSAGGTALLGFVLIAVSVLIGAWLLTSGGGSSETTAVNSVPDTVLVDASTTTLAVPTTRPPTTVRVTVANGTRQSGRAGKLRDKLAALGWNTEARAVDTNPKPQNDLLYYQSGYEVEAQFLATQIGLAAVDVQLMPENPPVIAADRQEANLLVIVGEGLAARIDAGTIGATVGDPAAAQPAAAQPAAADPAVGASPPA